MLIDTSPVEAANDAIDLLPAVDHVIVVVRSGRTARKTLQHSIEILQQHGASIMGVVLIGTPGLGRRQTYYDYYYTAEETPPKDGPREPAGGRAVPIWSPVSAPKDAITDLTESAPKPETVAARDIFPIPRPTNPGTEPST